MKLLLLIVVVLVIIWVLRGKRPRATFAAPSEPAAPAPQEAMLACAQCGLHLPKGEALPGRGGVFCSESHRSAYELTHPQE